MSNLSHANFFFTSIVSVSDLFFFFFTRAMCFCCCLILQKLDMDSIYNSLSTTKNIIICVLHSCCILLLKCFRIFAAISHVCYVNHDMFVVCSSSERHNMKEYYILFSKIKSERFNWCTTMSLKITFRNRENKNVLKSQL